MSKKTKLAVCISGQPRTWRHCKHSLDLLFKEFDVDYVLHSWSDVPPDERSDLLESYRPVAHIFEDRPDYTSQQQNLVRLFPHVPPIGVFDMAHGIRQSIDMALQHGGYDLIARVRYDAIFAGRFGAYRLKKKALFVPAWPDIGGCNDQFAVGIPEAMRIYGDYLTWLTGPDICAHHPGWFRPEQGLRCHLEQHLNANQIVCDDLDMKLLRPTMVGRSYEQVHEDSFHQVRKQSQWSAFGQRHGIETKEGSPIIAALSHLQAEHVYIEQYILSASESDRADIITGNWRRKIIQLDRMLAGYAKTNDMLSINDICKLTSVFLHLTHRDAATDGYQAVLLPFSVMSGDHIRSAEWIRSHPTEMRAVMADQEWFGQLSILGPLIQSRVRTR